MIDKFVALERIWLYSHFLNEQLVACENVVEDGYGFLGTSMAINLLENALKCVVDDYESNFNRVAKEACERGVLTDLEYSFVSFDNNSLRKLRNCFAHKNLSAMYLQFSQDALLYPMSEETTYHHFYGKYSSCIINIILKAVSHEQEENLDSDNELKGNAFKIHTYTIPELLELKGFPKDYLNGLDIPESELVRLIDNSSDVTMGKALFESLLSEKDKP